MAGADGGGHSEHGVPPFGDPVWADAMPEQLRSRAVAAGDWKPPQALIAEIFPGGLSSGLCGVRQIREAFGE